MILLISFGVLPIFSEGAYLRPFTLVGCRYYNIFLGGALSFLRACTFLAPLVFISLFFLSLFLLFTLLLLVVLFASASETNRYSFTESLLQQRGGGGLVQGVGGEGIVNYGEINNKNEANELTTMIQRLKYWLKR